MYNVNYQWDKLLTCVIGRAYPPEIFNFIKDPKLRNTFESLAIETEEDLLKLKKFLENRGIEVLRTRVDNNFDLYKIDKGYICPPLSPRDLMAMIDDKLYYPGIPNKNHAWQEFIFELKVTKYKNFKSDIDLKKSNVPEDDKNILLRQWEEFQNKDQEIFNKKISAYNEIFAHLNRQGNDVVASPIDYMNSSFITRLGKKMIIGTQRYYDDKVSIKKQFQKMFPYKKIYVMDSEGHSDGVYTPISEELVISALYDIDYSQTFKNAEVVKLPPEITLHNDTFVKKMHMNEHTWFIKGFEKDKNAVELVNYYFNSWIGNVQETAFMINILMLDKKNALVNTENKTVRDALKRHGVELHVVPFRHKWFWDMGVHCCTNDLNRAND